VRGLRHGITILEQPKRKGCLNTTAKYVRRCLSKLQGLTRQTNMLLVHRKGYKMEHKGVMYLAQRIDIERMKVDYERIMEMKGMKCLKSPNLNIW
jgi:hypothetical protein